MRSTTHRRLALIRRLQSGHPVSASAQSDRSSHATPGAAPPTARPCPLCGGNRPPVRVAGALDPQVADVTWVARRPSPSADVPPLKSEGSR